MKLDKLENQDGSIHISSLSNALSEIVRDNNDSRISRPIDSVQPPFNDLLPVNPSRFKNRLGVTRYAADGGHSPKSNKASTITQKSELPMNRYDRLKFQQREKQKAEKIMK